jgi:hypothetical protein
MTNAELDVLIPPMPPKPKAPIAPANGGEIELSRRELTTLFWPGRKLELIACYVPMAAPSLGGVWIPSQWPKQARQIESRYLQQRS